jgi:hypothetical protein
MNQRAPRRGRLEGETHVWKKCYQLVHPRRRRCYRFGLRPSCHERCRLRGAIASSLTDYFPVICVGNFAWKSDAAWLFWPARGLRRFRQSSVPFASAIHGQWPTAPQSAVSPRRPIASAILRQCLMHAGAIGSTGTRPIIRLFPASEISPDLVEEQGQVSERLSFAMRVRKQRGESILPRSLLEIR